MSGTSKPFSTPPSQSGNENGSSSTSGLRGTSQVLPDGKTVITAQEELTAKRTGGFSGALTASCARTRVGDIETVEQQDYSYDSRVLPVSTLWFNSASFPTEVPPGYQATDPRDVIASQFGKNDREDEGTGSPDMGLVQTNSEVFGASVKVSVMRRVFGESWKHNPKRLSALAEIFCGRTHRVARVPLVDVGPGESIRAEVDLTWASDQFLGTGGQGEVSYRILLER